MSQTIAVIGECMIEVRPSAVGGKFAGQRIDAGIRFGGDTLNCAVYLARQGVEVDYITALGDDPISDWMLEEWQREGVACELVSRVAQAVPGLYLIETDDSGERSFYYWRDQAPARRMFDDAADTVALFERLASCPYLYLSGITLALYQPSVRARLYELLDQYRRGGGKVCFDNNYRPRQWPNVESARHAFSQLYQRCDVALPTLDDELELFGPASQDDVIARLQDAGVTELVLKKGAEGCVVISGPDEVGECVEAVQVRDVVDTTAAGDSFNAGYLAGRFSGLNCREAAQRGNQLASAVIGYPGAIIPLDAMP